MSEQQPRGDEPSAERPPPGWAPPPAPGPWQHPGADRPSGYGRQVPGDQARYGQPGPGEQRGYGEPPAGQGPPPPGYDDPRGRTRRPEGSADLSPADQRLWATLTHLSGVVTFPVGPLVAFLVLRDRGLFVRDQTRDALNFQITVAAVYLVTWVLALVTVGVLGFLPALASVVLPVYVLVVAVVAAVRSNRGERYRYPLTLRLVR